MRELTQQKIDQAPDWATMYFIKDGICWYNEIFFQWETGNKIKCGNNFNNAEFKPIPRPEFDVNEYEFSDGNIKVAFDNDIVFVDVNYDDFYSQSCEFNKVDIIALAKLVKLTPEDLK